MSAGKSPAPAPIKRDDSEDRRRLARISARMLAVAELEDEALAEIDRITSAIWRQVCVRYIGMGFIIGIAAFVVVLGLSLMLLAAFTGANLGWRPVLVLIPMLLLAVAPFLYWRHFQYGLGRIVTKRPALYGEGSKATIETLEKLFEYLARRTAPRAYCALPGGTKRYLSRHIFMGRLRGLLLSERANDRNIVLSPYGLGQGGEIMIEAEPEDIIAALKPKRRGGPGREPKYAYTDALINLIDNPALADIDLGDEVKAQRQVEALLVTWFQDRADTSGDAPRGDLVRPYAEKIVTRLWITRGRKADSSLQG
jgi:hypothetical protein